jgi:hypothetical protein
MRSRTGAAVRLLIWSLLLLGPVAGLQAADPGRAAIDGLEARRDDGRAIVSFQVSNGVSADSLERIDSGIEVMFKHRVEVVGPRTFPIPDKTFARTVIKTRARYDSLTGRYSLTRSIEFKTKRKNAIEPIHEQHSTESPDEMRRWMTEFREVQVHDPARPFGDRELRVRVRSDLGRRYLLLIFPSTIDAHAACNLEP